MEYLKFKNLVFIKILCFKQKFCSIPQKAQQMTIVQTRKNRNLGKLWDSVFPLILLGMVALKERGGASKSTRLISRALCAFHICCHSGCLIASRRSSFFLSLLPIQQVWRSEEWGTTRKMRVLPCCLAVWQVVTQGSVFYICVGFVPGEVLVEGEEVLVWPLQESS